MWVHLNGTWNASRTILLSILTSTPPYASSAWRFFLAFIAAAEVRDKRTDLEVTAENEPAINLYRSIGFRLTRTLYKPSHYVEAPSF